MRIAIPLLLLSLAVPTYGSHPKLHQSVKAIPGSYIVVLRDEVTDGDSVAGEIAMRHGGMLRRIYRAALNGFSIELTEREAEKVADDPRVDFVEENATGVFDEVWNLDRIDQR